MIGLFKRKKKTLRDICRELYGEKYVSVYDALCCGSPILSVEETKDFLAKLDTAKRVWNKRINNS